MKFQVKANNVEDHEALLAFLFQAGYKYGSRSSIKELTDYFGWFAFNTTVITPEDKNMGGNTSFVNGRGKEYTLPQDFAAVIDRVINPTKTDITIYDVAGFTATVTKNNIQVGCQTISHEKFAEIVAAVEEVKE